MIEKADGELVTLVHNTPHRTVWLELIGAAGQQKYRLRSRELHHKTQNEEIYKTENIVLERHEALQLALTIIEDSKAEDAKELRIINVRVETPKEKKRSGKKRRK